jgi:L-amino acid N-acyltransferase YncA
VRVRAARPEDAAAVADIYNAGMRERSSTFETREREPGEIAERIAHERHPFLVAELDGRLAGFAATAFRHE